MPKEKILVIGANGQLGSALTKALRKLYGQEQVIATDVHLPLDGNNYLPFEILDATDASKMSFLIERYRITQIYHFDSSLTTKSEINPLKTWNLNIDSLFNVFEAARAHNIKKVFFPSSIAVFGRNTPRLNTPQDTLRTPETVYGMSKVAGENWCVYYHNRYDIDVRSLRFPIIISPQKADHINALNYTWDIFNHGIKEEAFDCFIAENNRLPMIYIDDAVRATLELMELPEKKVSIRSSYNLAGFSFSPQELISEISKHIPNLKISFKPDERQKIASSLPESIDDSQAQLDWGWKPQFGLSEMVEVIFKELKKSVKAS
jgi:nucleoside-diphosphate-sugar epimerase